MLKEIISCSVTFVQHNVETICWSKVESVLKKMFKGKALMEVTKNFTLKMKILLSYKAYLKHILNKSF